MPGVHAVRRAACGCVSLYSAVSELHQVPPPPGGDDEEELFVCWLGKTKQNKKHEKENSCEVR